MTPTHPTDPPAGRTGPARWGDADVAAALLRFSLPDAPSQRQYASDHDVPRSTLGHWLRREAPQGVSPAAAAFLRCPDGSALLRRLVLALVVTFHFRPSCGLRSLGSFLELAGLDWLVATSYGALHELAGRLERDLVALGDAERARLAQGMPTRPVAACLDENFHRGRPYLVGIEPASNFLLLETHSDRRDGQTWTDQLAQAVAGLNVEVALVCSDRARGLLACAEHGLGVPHSPDLMHAQREVQRPMLLPLRRAAEAAREEAEAARAGAEGAARQKEAHEAGPRGAGRPPDFEGRIREAAGRQERAQQAHEQCEGHLRQAREAVRALADDSHPFDPRTGAPLDAKQVGERLDAHIDVLERVVDEAGLPEKADVGVAKGYGWVTALMGLVAWFWVLARERVAGMGLPPDAERAVLEELLPGLYWRQQARRGRDAAQKRHRGELAERLLKHAWRPGGSLAGLGEAQRGELLRQGEALAGLFVRSSSCVEGRNGRLSLLQHGHLRLSEGRLKAQTVIHNYLARRPDGTTAAGRFFGKEPADLFEALLSRMPNLPRPAAKRPRKASEGAAKAG